MKKLNILIIVVVLNMAYTSCTPQSLSNDIQKPQACCGEEGTIPPPPPPPPPHGGGFGG